jgi:DNA-binding NarL/FixJ family response regulator
MLYRILIADEDISTRHRLAQALQQNHSSYGFVYQVQALSPSVLESGQANHTECDLLIMTLRPNRQRAAAIRRLARTLPQMKVILLGNEMLHNRLPGDLTPLVAAIAPTHVTDAELLRLVDETLQQTQSQLDIATAKTPDVMMAEVQHVLEELQAQAQASSVLYLDYFGDIINQRGSVYDVNLEALAVSVATTFVSSYEMAQLLGELDLNHISIHEGTKYQICATNVGEGRVLALIFDTSAMAAKPKQGFVSLLLRRVASQLRRIHAVEEQWYVARHVELAHELGGNDSVRGFWAQPSSVLQVAA